MIWYLRIKLLFHPIFLRLQMHNLFLCEPLHLECLGLDMVEEKTWPQEFHLVNCINFFLNKIWGLINYKNNKNEILSIMMPHLILYNYRINILMISDSVIIVQKFYYILVLLLIFCYLCKLRALIIMMTLCKFVTMTRARNS